jgi:hypothetical protein
MRAQTLSAGVDWALTDWAALGVTATQASERGTILGSDIAGPIGVNEGADTTALNVSARVGFGDGWVTTVAFDQGVTRLDLQPAFAISGRDTLYSQSYGIALTKEGLFGDDVLGISVSRPLQANGVTFGNTAFGPRARLPIAALTEGRGAPQSDIQMGYVTTFLDGSLALSANAGYQTNVNGEQGRDGVTAAARARIRF